MNPANPSIPPAIKRTNIGRVFGLVFVAILALALLVFGIWRIRLGGSVRSSVAAIREKGLPVDWNDLAHWPLTVPDEQNAALLFNRAFDAADSNSCDRIARMNLPLRNAPLTNRAEIVACIQSNAAAMEMICGISNASSSRYPVDYLAGMQANLPHLPHIKNFAELFAWDASLKADQGDTVGATRDIQATFKLSHSLDAEPVLISQLVSAAVLGIAEQTLERTLERAPLSEEQLTELSEELRTSEATNRFWTAMVGERALGGEALRLLSEDPRKFIVMANKMSKDDQTDVPPGFYRGYFVRLTGFWVRDRNFFLHAMDTNIAAFTVAPPASLQFTNAANQIETNAHKGVYLMSSMLLPALSRTVVRDADNRARLRTAIAAIAIERWRAAHSGTIPDSLSDLVPHFLPAIPTDPYDGQPLRFKKLTKGYVVYSIGPNGQDDGGKERIPTSIKVPQEERNRYDITFTVER